MRLLTINKIASRQHQLTLIKIGDISRQSIFKYNHLERVFEHRAQVMLNSHGVTLGTSGKCLPTYREYPIVCKYTGHASDQDPHTNCGEVCVFLEFDEALHRWSEVLVKSTCSLCWKMIGFSFSDLTNKVLRYWGETQFNFQKEISDLFFNFLVTILSCAWLMMGQHPETGLRLEMV